MRVFARISLLAALVLPVVAQPAGVEVPRAEAHRLDSHAGGTGYRIEVRLPETYGQGDLCYPVLYLLDADIWFGLATDITDNLAAVHEMPEVIVVGIAYGRGIDDWWQQRARDYLPACRNGPVPADIPLAGGAERFQEFLAGELFPFIDARYRTKAGDRTLVGLSHAGLFAVHSLLTQPGLFQRYVIAAPSLDWDREAVLATEAAVPAAHREPLTRVFLGWGAADGGPQAQERWLNFSRRLEERHHVGLRLTMLVLPDETHLSAFPGLFTRGIKTVYREP